MGCDGVNIWNIFIIKKFRKWFECNSFTIGRQEVSMLTQKKAPLTYNRFEWSFHYGL